MEKTTRRYQDFEDIVADLFRAEGFTVDRNVRFTSGVVSFVVDLILTSRPGARAAVDIKLFRTLALPSETLFQVGDRLEQIRQLARCDRSVFVTSARIPLPYRRSLTFDNSRLTIYDHDALKALAARYPVLAFQLDELFRETLIRPDVGPELSTDDIPSTEILTEPLHAPPLDQPPDREIEAKKGEQLCASIHKVKSGRKDYRKFEIAVEAALKYIFATDLVSWSSQKISDTGHNRYDLIARVSSKDDVWQMIKDQFQSQYVIFECKNYVDEIRQGEIYTTEKYLHQKALRSVAFIISRNGAHQSGLAAARGALREHGKLIVSLTVADVCKLLSLKDDNQDYNGLLFDKIDDMLMMLER